MTTPFADSGVPPVLEAVGVGKRFGAFTALNGADFQIRPGEVTALAGPNGAGKTTLFRVLGGGLRPDVGQVLLGGADVTGQKPWQLARRGIGRLFQDVRIFNGLTVRENVEAALVTGVDRRGEADRWLDYAGLAARSADRAAALGFAERKLLAIARLMATRARVLLLDEPTAALSEKETARVYGFLRRLADEQHVSIALVEHNLAVVRKYADTVCFLHEGEVLKTGTPAEVFSDERVKALYAVDSEMPAVGENLVRIDSRERLPIREGKLPDGMVRLLEEGNVFPSLSVADNFSLVTLGVPRRLAEMRRVRVLELFPFLGDRLEQTAGTLSGGQRQALAIAMAMCRDAQAWLFEEPSAGLAPCVAARMFAAISAFAADDPDRRMFILEKRKE